MLEARGFSVLASCGCALLTILLIASDCVSWALMTSRWRAEDTSPNDTSLKTSLLLTPPLYDTSLIDTSPNDLP
jgi:hypothetical protein